MSMVIVLVLLAVAAAGGAVAVAVALAAALSGTQERRPGLSPALAGAARHHTLVGAAAWLLMALVGGTVVLVVLFGLTREAVLTSLVPLLLALSAVLVLLVGELTWPRPDGPVRHATLDSRVAGDVTRGRWSRVLSGVTVLAATAYVAGALAARPDGASVGWEDATRGSAAGPFPGTTYVVPQAIVTALLLLAADGVVRAALQRSAVAGAGRTLDHALRQDAVDRAARIASCGVLLTLGCDAVFGGGAVARAWQSGGLHLLGLGLVVVGGLVALASCALLVAPVLRPRSVRFGPTTEPATTVAGQPS